MFHFKRLLRSIRHAVRGLDYVIRHEKNFQLELVMAILVVVAGLFFHVHRGEWMILAILCFSVLAFELMNTAVERVVNVLKPSPHPYARVIKDVMAAGVFIFSVGALVIGAVIFLPHIIEQFF
jgi:diacylglycerol kinase